MKKISNMEGMEWQRLMHEAKEILRQKMMSEYPRDRDTPFISSFLGFWEVLSSITTGETPLLDFLIV
jgi:hypothetical protein